MSETSQMPAQVAPRDNRENESFGGRAARAQLSESRWHFQHGPIDLIIDVVADAEVRDAAVADCWRAFHSILPGLVAELPLLRRPASERRALHGPVALRMERACDAFKATRFITPMAAVAGAVADELIVTLQRPGVQRASINNGGDIALHLTPGARHTVGILTKLGELTAPDSAFEVFHEMPVRGVATSGWRGRSLSLGIADSVTVLARNAAGADAAATLIANAVDCRFPGIVRARASQLKDDTDLGERLVTVQVPELPQAMKLDALARGRCEAEWWRYKGLIHAAALFLQGSVEVVLPTAERRLDRRELFELSHV